MRVYEVMSKAVETPVRRAARLMKGRSIGALVVTSANGKLAGIITVSDLLDLVSRTIEPEPKREAHGNSARRPRRGRKRSGDVWDE